MKHRVSAIIPTFNRAYHIERALGSVLRQTVSCDEIIVIDDGSTDGTQKIVENLSAKHPQIVYLWQENQGASAARNRGIAVARNQIIAFLDSDDTWSEAHIEESLECFSTFPDVGAVFAKYELVGWEKKISESELAIKYQRRDHATKLASNISNFYYKLDANQCLSSLIMKQIGFSTSTLVINWNRYMTKFTFDTGLIFCEDVDFYLQLFFSGIPIGYINKIHSQYLIHHSNTISIQHTSLEDRIKKIYYLIRHTEKKLYYCSGAIEYDEIAKQLSTHYCILGGLMCENGLFAEANYYFGLSFRRKKQWLAIKHLITFHLFGMVGYRFIFNLIKKLKSRFSSNTINP